MYFVFPAYEALSLILYSHCFQINCFCVIATLDGGAISAHPELHEREEDDLEEDEFTDLHPPTPGRGGLQFFSQNSCSFLSQNQTDSTWEPLMKEDIIVEKV